jgi:hypothetical protein
VYDLGLSGTIVAVHRDVAREHDQHGRVPLGQVELERRVGGKADVADRDRREGPGRPPDAGVLAGDDPDAAGAIRQIDHRDRVAGDRLVAGRRLLVLRRQVDPELDHAERAAGLGEGRRVQLLVDDAAAGRHPLHVARADRAAAARRIAVRHLAVIDDGDGLEAGMRVSTHAARLLGRREDVRPGVVEKQERAHGRRVRRIGDERADRKAVADPMPARCGCDPGDRLHDPSSNSCRTVIRGRYSLSTSTVLEDTVMKQVTCPPSSR